MKRHFCRVLPSFHFTGGGRPRTFTSRAPRAFTALLACAGFLGGGLIACQEAPEARAARETPALTDAAQDASTAGLRWAKTVEWSGSGATRTLTLFEPWKDARAPLHYVLGTVPSSGASAISVTAAEDVQKIPVPARRIAALAAVHTGYLAALGAEDRIVAVDARRHVYSPVVRAAIDAGMVAEVGSGATLNVEHLLAARPDLVLTNAVGTSEYAALERLRRAGIPVLVTAEWMEHHPLARAEWIRLIGLIIGEEARADSLFASVESAYLRIVEDSRRLPRRPTVLLGGPFRDQWFVSGGRSFMARLIGDAGGDYVWRADSTAGGVPLSFEAVLTQARDARIWLHPGVWRSLEDGLRQDARFREFSAFQRGDVYNSDARLHADGANDYWEVGVVRPDRVLADLRAIFHGDDDSLFYYRKVPP